MGKFKWSSTRRVLIHFSTLILPIRRSFYEEGDITMRILHGGSSIYHFGGLQVLRVLRKRTLKLSRFYIPLWVPQYTQNTLCAGVQHLVPPRFAQRPGVISIGPGISACPHVRFCFMNIHIALHVDTSIHLVPPKTSLGPYETSPSPSEWFGDRALYACALRTYRQINIKWFTYFGALTWYNIKYSLFHTV